MSAQWSSSSKDFSALIMGLTMTVLLVLGQACGKFLPVRSTVELDSKVGIRSLNSVAEPIDTDVVPGQGGVFYRLDRNRTCLDEGIVRASHGGRIYIEPEVTDPRAINSLKVFYFENLCQADGERINIENIEISKYNPDYLSYGEVFLRRRNLPPDMEMEFDRDYVWCKNSSSPLVGTDVIVSKHIGDNVIQAEASFDLDLTQAPLNSRVFYTRSGPASYYDSSGILRYAAPNVGRVDHNPLTGEKFGLLLEEERTNYYRASHQLDDEASWQLTNLSVVADQGLAPDGTLSADLLVPGADETIGRYISSGSFFGTDSRFQWSASAYVKTNDRRFFRITLATSDNEIYGGTRDEFYIIVDMTNLTVFGTRILGRAVPLASAVQKLPNNWMRVWLSGSPDPQYVQGPNDPRGERPVRGSFALLGENRSSRGPMNPAKSVYLWGVQLETGAFPTSYIPTSGGPGVRGADFARITDLASWYNSNQGSFKIKARLMGDNDADQNLLSFFGLNGQSYFGFVRNKDSKQVQAKFGDNGMDQAMLASPMQTWNTGDKKNLVMSYGQGSVEAYSNGQRLADPVSAVPSLQITGLVLGRDSQAEKPFNGHIERIKYWPNKLESEIVQQATASGAVRYQAKIYSGVQAGNGDFQSNIVASFPVHETAQSGRPRYYSSEYDFDLKLSGRGGGWISAELVAKIDGNKKKLGLQCRIKD